MSGATGKSGESAGNSEHRKEQNRIASRTYRQRRRQKLELLNQLLQQEPDGSGGSAAAAAGQSNATPGGGLASGAAPAGPPPIMPALVRPNEVPVTGREVPPGSTLSGGLLGDFTPQARPGAGSGRDGEGTFAPTTSLHGSFGALGFIPVTASPGYQAPLSQDSVVSSEPFPPLWRQASHIPRTLPPTVPLTAAATPAFASAPAQEDPMTQVLRNLEKLSFGQKRQLLQIIGAQTTEPEVLRRHRANRQRQQILLARAGPSAAASAPPSSSMYTSGSAYYSQRGETNAELIRRVSQDLGARLPDLHTNLVSITQENFFAAIVENSCVIGMTDGRPLFDEDGLSPFSISQESGHDPGSLEVVRQRYAHVAKDLQPVDSQLTSAHHPWVDVIPFRAFRERAMAAITCNPPMFDEEELCHDLCLDGLMCWGGASQRGGGAPAGHLDMGAGVPWDVRSWEPKVWFLRKYWFLVGGWEDEMWRAARWWHAMREERISGVGVEGWSVGGAI